MTDEVDGADDERGHHLPADDAGPTDQPHIRPGRSVFEDPGSDIPWDEATTATPPVEDVTDTYAAIDPRIADRGSPPGGRRVLDGAAFGVYEDDAPRSRVPIVVGSVLGVAVLVVGFLVWRAVNTDADLAVPDPSPTTSPSTTTPSPTVDAALALVPPNVAACAAADPQPVDEPARVVLQCPLDGVPELLAFVLYATADDRDAAFDGYVDEVDVPTSGAECALGQNGSHDYIGVQRVGRVACRSAGGRVDFVWTTDDAPLLVRSGGGGPFARHYRFWSELVDRTDAAFPLPAEQALLDRLPDELQRGCGRDLGLNVDAPGVAAVRCEPEADAVDVASSVQFGDVDTMTAWITSRRESLTDNVFDETGDACTPDGFGQREVVETTTTTASDSGDDPSDDASERSDDPPPPPPPAPDAGFQPYDIEGSTGQVLCFVNSSGLNALFWVRDGSRIGSIAVSDRSTGATMVGLLAWWEAGGHRP